MMVCGVVKREKKIAIEKLLNHNNKNMYKLRKPTIDKIHVHEQHTYITVGARDEKCVSCSFSFYCVSPNKNI